MIEPNHQDPKFREAQTALLGGIERTREMCADTKKRLQELADMDLEAVTDRAIP